MHLCSTHISICFLNIRRPFYSTVRTTGVWKMIVLPKRRHHLYSFCPPSSSLSLSLSLSVAQSVFGSIPTTFLIRPFKKMKVGGTYERTNVCSYRYLSGQIQKVPYVKNVT